MDENNYISIDKMQKEADEKFEKEVREHNAEVDAKRKARQDAENAEMQELYKGMVESIKAEQENQKSRKLEEAVSKASKEVEDKYDNNSIIKSERRISMDKSYKNLLDGITGKKVAEKPKLPGQLNINEEEYNKFLNYRKPEEDTRSPLDKEYSNLIKKLDSVDDDDTSIF